MPAFRPAAGAALIGLLLAAPALAQEPPRPSDTAPPAAPMRMGAGPDGQGGADQGGAGRGGHGQGGGMPGRMGGGMMGRMMAHHPARLTVTGEGRATAIPDLAVVTLGVSSEAATAAEAMAATSARQQAVIDTLRQAGVAPRDIQTATLTLSPRMDYPENGAPRLTGYAAQNSVQVRVRDLAGLGALLDRLVQGGANEIAGIAFAREDMAAAEDEARIAAVADARRRARQMAEAAGMRLGALRSLSDGVMSAPGPMPMMAMRADAKAAAPIEAGEMELRAQVMAVYDLLPAQAPGAGPQGMTPPEGAGDDAGQMDGEMGGDMGGGMDGMGDGMPPAPPAPGN